MICFVVSFSFFLTSIPTKKVFACSCMAPPSVLEARDNSHAVFSGEVIDMEGSMSLLGGSSADPVTVTFNVHQAWKGVNSKEFVVYTAESEASCGFTFEKNNAYLVYANEHEGKYEVSLCSRTASLSTAADDVNMLGAGFVPTGNLKQNQDWYATPWPYLVGAIVLLAGVIYLFVKRNKRIS